VESHHGNVAIEDREGGGARLRIRLPRMTLRRSVAHSAAAQPS
jgi:signal transduction histidine kinase